MHCNMSPMEARAKVPLFKDPASLDLLRQVERIARSEATVMICGETGTGKELIARHVHLHSGRSGPFVAVNCGAFSESLIDAELFGHEAGAFTGAKQSRAGWFEAANGGTLFLDEIGDLSPALQVKLLRVLQERQVVRVGSRRPVALDVRVVAATNVELRLAVQAQHFRADLFYRLSVATIDLPPLRERPGDIVALAEHFLVLYGKALGIEGASLAPDARDALLAYAWPGNIRELENVLHYALIVCRDGVVQARDLRLAAPMVLRGGREEPRTDRHERDDGEAAGTLSQLDAAYEALLRAKPPQLFARAEQALVRAAFAASGENQVHAARLLGITRTTLRTLLKRHGLLAHANGVERLDGVNAEPERALAH
jgi:sigma-54-specific transcriptional regulator